MDAYFQYLKKAFQSVLVASFEDESLTVLKEMENKTYYFARLQQIFSEIYSAERQKKIQQLLDEIEKLTEGEFKGEENQEIRKEIGMAQKQGEFQRKSINKAELFVENEKLGKKIQKIRVEHLQEIELMNKSQTKIVEGLKTKSEELEKQVEKLTTEIRKTKEQKQEFEVIISQQQNQLNQNQILSRKLEQKLKQETKIRQLNDQKLKESDRQVYSLREQRSMLEAKVERLQISQQSLQQKIEAYGKKIASLYEDKPKDLTKERKLGVIQINDDVQGGQKQSFSSLLCKLTSKEEELSFLYKNMREINKKLEQKEKQLLAYKIHAEKMIGEAQEKERRLIEKNRVRLADLERQNHQLRNPKVKDSTKNSNQKTQQLKEEMQHLKDENAALSFSLKSLEQNLNAHMKQYEKIGKILNEQRQQHSMIVMDLEQKIQTLQKLEREMAKRVQILNKRDQAYQGWDIQKKELEKRIVQLKQEIQNQRDAQQMLTREIEKRQIQQKIKQKKDKTINESLKVKEVQAKVLSLQNDLQLLKKLNREGINQKQRKISLLKEQKQVIEYKFIEIQQKLKEENEIRKKYEKKSYDLETQMQELHKKLMNSQEGSRNQKMEILKEYQQRLKQSNRQTEVHYVSLLRSAGERNGKNSQQIETLIKDYKEANDRLEQQVWEQKKRIMQDDHKIKDLTEIKNRLSINLREAEEIEKELIKKQGENEMRLNEQKQNRIKIIRYYQDKFKNFAMMFRSFKFQICTQFKSAIETVKTEWISLKKSTEDMKLKYRKLLNGKKQELETNLEEYMKSYQAQKLSDISQVSEKKMREEKKMAEQKLSRYENEIKSMKMDHMTSLAEKQYEIEDLREKQLRILKKVNELESIAEKTQIRYEKSQLNEQALKEIIAKMEAKVNDAERNENYKKKQAAHLEKNVEQLINKINLMEESHRLELKEAREKYRQDNERMFSKYERQFNKMMVLGKKTSQGNSLGQNSFMQSQIPTKGKQDKIQKLQKEIQSQKRLIEGLEKKTRKV